MITLVYDSISEVNKIYERLKKQGLDPPRENTKYGIYQFFAKDPENRALEFQCFLHPVPPI
jgi:predicted lactoylglutathione lyase